MKPVIIIAIAFVLLIPIPVFAQVVDFNIEEEVYYQFQMITMSGVVDVNPDIPDIFVEIFSPEKKLVGFSSNINPDGTFWLQFSADPTVYTIDGEYTYKITYGNSIEKTINYQKFRDIADFVDQTKHPCSYVDRYKNELGYEKWFDDNYPEYVSIYEAVGILDNQKLCNTHGMNESEKQAREEIPNPCANIKEPKVSPEYQGDVGLNDPVYMKAVRDTMNQYQQQIQQCSREYQNQIEQRVAELQCGDFKFGEYTPIKDYDLVYDLFSRGLSEKNLDTSEVLVQYKGTTQYEKECQSFYKEWQQLGKETERWNESCPDSGSNPNGAKQSHLRDIFSVCRFATLIPVGQSVEETENICGIGTTFTNGQCIPDTKSSKGGGCLIATATYGSEMASEVQQLREIRDNQLLNTESGTNFMNSFNDFYYSFSPIIADYERENPIFKEAVKLAITPMISSLSLLNYVDMDSEVEVLGYGISLILLNLGMYLGIPAVVIIGIRKIK